MPAFNQNIKKLAKDNTDFRRELVTNDHSQLVLMCIQPGEDIGEEVHDVDQVLVFVKGLGDAVLDGATSPVGKGSLLVVPAGSRHNVINSGDKAMRLFTIYSPPQHPRGTVHRTRADAAAAEVETV